MAEVAVRKKRILYVGGLDTEVTDAILHAAFIPFGEIREVQIPMDHVTERNRGFGFVEFEEEEDAAAALENMNDAELLGRVLKVNIAKPMKNKLGSKQSVWADADEWYQNKLNEDGDFDMRKDVEEMAKVHRDTLEPEM